MSEETSTSVQPSQTPRRKPAPKEAMFRLTDYQTLPRRKIKLTASSNQSQDPDNPDENTGGFDEAGEKKIDSDGCLLGGRQYRMPVFTLPLRHPSRLYMLAVDASRPTGFRDSYLFFVRNPDMVRIILSPEEREQLQALGHLPQHLRNRTVALVTARSMFKKFGALVVEGGRRVIDDYFEAKVLELGFVENDPVIGYGSQGQAALAEHDMAMAAQAAADGYQNSDYESYGWSGAGMMSSPPASNTVTGAGGSTLGLTGSGSAHLTLDVNSLRFEANIAPLAYYSVNAPPSTIPLGAPKIQPDLTSNNNIVGGGIQGRRRLQQLPKSDDALTQVALNVRAMDDVLSKRRRMVMEQQFNGSTAQREPHTGIAFVPQILQPSRIAVQSVSHVATESSAELVELVDSRDIDQINLGDKVAEASTIERMQRTSVHPHLLCLESDQQSDSDLNNSRSSTGLYPLSLVPGQPQTRVPVHRTRFGLPDMPPLQQKIVEPVLRQSQNQEQLPGIHPYYAYQMGVMRNQAPNLMSPQMASPSAAATSSFS
ncbi:hypothetical protein GQ42DRAFT_163378 [Ramicandelaber brevisporus]|nr:hypothetical protein GQ42DRAFT_163378 [Ramicandelaber brevisporus]